MTDLHRLTALLDRWGVQYAREVADTEGGAGLTVVSVGGGYSQGDKITGYAGFITQFEFTPDGRFARMGAWE